MQTKRLRTNICLFPVSSSSSSWLALASLSSSSSRGWLRESSLAWLKARVAMVDGDGGDTQKFSARHAALANVRVCSFHEFLLLFWFVGFGDSLGESTLSNSFSFSR